MCTPLCLITENNLDPEKQIRQPGCVSAPESYFLSVTVITCAVVVQVFEELMPCSEFSCTYFHFSHAANTPVLPVIH